MKAIVNNRLVEVGELHASEGKWFTDNNGIFAKVIAEDCKDAFVEVDSAVKEQWEKEHPAEL